MGSPLRAKHIFDAVAPCDGDHCHAACSYRFLHPPVGGEVGVLDVHVLDLDLAQRADAYAHADEPAGVFGVAVDHRPRAVADHDRGACDVIHHDAKVVNVKTVRFDDELCTVAVHVVLVG